MTTLVRSVVCSFSFTINARVLLPFSPSPPPSLPPSPPGDTSFLALVVYRDTTIHTYHAPRRISPLRRRENLAAAQHTIYALALAHETRHEEPRPYARTAPRWGAPTGVTARERKREREIGGEPSCRGSKRRERKRKCERERERGVRIQVESKSPVTCATLRDRRRVSTSAAS